jgi:hypothetical protein
MITSVVRQKNPVANESPNERAGTPRNAAVWGISPKAPPQFCLFLSKSDTPGFAPWRQLFKPTTGALHCTGTVAGAFPEGIAKISDPVLLLRRQDYKNYNSKSGAL